MVGPPPKTVAALSVGVVVLILSLTGCGDAGRGAAQDGLPAKPATSSAAASSAPNAAPELAAPGATLQTLSTPPERSLWALSADAFDAEVEVAVEFQPYGIGPSSFGPSIVVLITAATVKTPRARAPELAGRNAILVLGSDPVASGGDYSGTVVTRKQGDRIMLVLKDVLRKSGS